MLEEATSALSRLDSERLEELGRRAQALRAELAAGTKLVSMPELIARFRVFAGVLKATGKDLAILERAGETKRAVAREEMKGVRWVL